jgi:hypothetical protein
MKRFFIVLVTILIIAPLLITPVAAAKSTPTVSITLQNPLPDGYVLAVGETHTFKILITSDQPFTLAMALPNAYYPGRGVFWHDSDRVTKATSVTLQLTIKGKNSTADLPGVCDWPTVGTCWPQGTAPLAIAAGVRFKGGQVISETFAFSVKVP